MNATVIYQPSSGMNATVTKRFTCIAPTPATQPDTNEGLAMTPVNFTVGTSSTNSDILNISLLQVHLMFFFLYGPFRYH